MLSAALGSCLPGLGLADLRQPDIGHHHRRARPVPAPGATRGGVGGVVRRVRGCACGGVVARRGPAGGLAVSGRVLGGIRGGSAGRCRRPSVLHSKLIRLETGRRTPRRRHQAMAARAPLRCRAPRYPLMPAPLARHPPVLATSFIRDGCGLPTPPFGSRGGARPTPGRPRCACRALRGQAAAAGSGSAARSPGAVAPR